jgi:long-chain acyl-CoA synthetase
MLDCFSTTVAACQSIPQSFFDLSSSQPDAIAYYYPSHSPSGAIAWFSRTRIESLTRVKKIRAHLEKLGVSTGTKVAIIAGTRPEWMEIDLAILSLGAVCVSIYPSLPPAEVGFILADSETTVVFAENQEQLDKLTWLSQQPITLPARDSIPETTALITMQHIIAIEQLSQTSLSYTSLADILAAEVPTTTYDFSGLTRDTISSLVYTSGTTGPAKGVIQTHGNHLSNVEQAIRSNMFALDGSLFLFLPLAHSFARLIAYLGFLSPATLKFAGVASTTSSKVDLARVAKEMCNASAEVVPVVPRLLEKVKDSIIQKSRAGTFAARILSITLQASQRVWQAQQSNGAPSLLDQIIVAATGSIRTKIKEQIFGTCYRHAISGGAKLPVDVANFFWSLDIPVFEGYGLTETCVATNVNRINRYRLGSVGPAFDFIQTKIAEDGEILFKGPNITQGYYKRPRATEESWDSEGWFHTGDIGHLDADGFLFITDRKKDLIVTAGGKKVPPIKVENLLIRSPEVDHAIYFGDGKPYCVALVSLNQAARTLDTAAQEKLIESIRVDTNKELASFEEVKKIALLPQELTVENGMLTPTLKVKRKVVINTFRSLIESLYASS